MSRGKEGEREAKEGGVFIYQALTELVPHEISGKLS